MAPITLQLFRRMFDTSTPPNEFRAQWTHPGDVFSVLLILGGDVVARALAQLAGSRWTPVAFSFGMRVCRNWPALRQGLERAHADLATRV